MSLSSSSTSELTLELSSKSFDGYQYVYSTAKAALTKNNFGVGFKAKDFTLFANM